MRVERIELAGFRGFRDRVEIPFGASFAVIEGANGAGKSTICDALEFCLTGEISKYVVEKAAKERVADYIWWRGETPAKEHFVRVYFRNDSGDQTIITRNREGCDRSDDEILRLFCSEASPQDALKVLVETTIIRDESIAALSLDITDTERYSRVQRALGSVSTERLLARATTISRSVEENYRRVEQQLATQRSQITTLLTQRSEAQSQLARSDQIIAATNHLQTELKIKSSDPTELLTAARSYTSAQQSRIRDVQEAADRVRRCAAEVHEIESRDFIARLKSAQDELLTLEEQINAAQKEYSEAEQRLKIEKDADDWAAAYSSLLEHGSRVGLQNGHCPLCSAAKTNAEFQAAISSAKRRLAERHRLSTDAQAFAISARNRHRNLLESRNIAQLNLSGLQGRAAAASRLRDEMQQTAQRLGIGLDVLLTPERLNALLNRERDRAFTVEKQARVLAQSAEYSRVLEMEANLRSLQDDLQRTILLSARSRKATDAAKAINHAIIRTAAEVVDERLAMISPLLSELFLRLRPHIDWRNIEYRIRGDVRKFLSLSVGDELNPQFVFSSGQRRITGLAFLLSVHLSRQWSAWNSLVLDDPVQHIDDYRALNLVELLSAIRMDKRQVICAVEDEALADLLCRRLRASYAEPGRRIVVEQGPGGGSRIVSSREIIASQKRVIESVVPTQAAS